MMGRAAQEAGGKLYIPASMDAANLGAMMLKETGVYASNGEGSEPCYLSLVAGNAGSNDDGTDHTGYIVVDVVNFTIVDLVDRVGRSKLAGQDVYLSGHSMGTGLNHIETLKGGLGLYLVKCGTHPLEFYSSMRCRCGCLCASGYWRMEDAQRKASSVGGSVVKITQAYLDNFQKTLI